MSVRFRVHGLKSQPRPTPLPQPVQQVQEVKDEVIILENGEEKIEQKPQTTPIPTPLTRPFSFSAPLKQPTAILSSKMRRVHEESFM